MNHQTEENSYKPIKKNKMDEDKVITYHIDAGDGELITTDLQAGLEAELPSYYDLECEHDEADEDGTIQEIIIKIKKIMTQAEVDALPEKQ